MSYQVEGVLNWGGVVHRSEEMIFESQNNNLLKELVAHQELLARSRNVSISMLDSHTSISGLLYL